MAMQLPIVTPDDLRAFHQKHFPHAPSPTQFIYEAEAQPAEEYYDYEDDGLGYYEDGVKRTLTDEQIALFRHTEIQTILRERRRRRDSGESSEPDLTPKQTTQNPKALGQNAEAKTSAGSTPIETTEKDGVTNKVQEGGVKKQPWREGPRKDKIKRTNAKSRRLNKESRKEKKKRQREGSMVSGKTDEDSESDEWDPWHQANGPDVQKDTTVELDY